MVKGAAQRRPAASPHGYAKSRVTRAQILAAALAEASERGLHKASVARIAARANTAVGSLSYHFGSRDELLRAMMQQLTVDLFERLAAAHSAEGDVFERHRRELLAYVEYVRANPSHIRLTDEIKFLEPDLYRQGVEGWVEHLAAMIRSGIAEGSVRPMSDAEVRQHAHFLLGGRHFLEEMLGDDPAQDTQVVDAYIELVRNGLGTQPARAGTSKRKRARR